AGVALGLLGSLLAAVRDERIPSERRTAEQQAAAVRTLSVSGSPGGPEPSADATYNRAS
ncbi:MAG: hypothetical protein H0U12_06335, partial [Thermoleophilaceae bacterium]|nr:hypothetical protein [Thermoleophilaceae bacterium]